ncbi:MAG: prephenate dehydrogenase [Candidatus Aminicenantes bacterium]|nr:prephenate dehydrogenase [Candidatus Aminicenantes bacterium]
MKIAILGTGHMGLWLIKEMSLHHQICVFDSDKTKTKKIRNINVLKDYAGLKKSKPELLINTVSLKNTVEAFMSAIPYLSSQCLLADMASVKGRIPEFYRSSGFSYVSIHPMFGPTFANVEDMAEENVILIKESATKGKLFFRDFFARLKLNIFECSFEEHDRTIAYSLTLPFASSMVFAACMKTSAVPGSTFKKHRDIARGLLSEDNFLLSEILFNPHSLPQLEKVSSMLEFLKHVIREKDEEEAHKFFQRLRENIKVEP